MPGTFSAGSRLILVIFALAHFERKIIPYSQPVGWTSEAYFAAPVTLAGPSTRLILVPMTVRCSGQRGIRNYLGFVGDRQTSGFESGLQNAWIRAATAKISRT